MLTSRITGMPQKHVVTAPSSPSFHPSLDSLPLSLSLCPASWNAYWLLHIMSVVTIFESVAFSHSHKVPFSLAQWPINWFIINFLVFRLRYLSSVMGFSLWISIFLPMFLILVLSFWDMGFCALKRVYHLFDRSYFSGLLKEFYWSWI